MIINESTIGQVLEILIPIIATALGTVLINLANKYADMIKQKTKSEKIDRYVRLLNETVKDVVVSLNQTTVDKLKEAATDGKLTPEEIEMVKADAITTVTDILGITGVEVLALAFEDLNALIATKIEKAVREVSNETSN